MQDDYYKYVNLIVSFWENYFKACSALLRIIYMLKASATIYFAKMIYYGKNSCVSVGNYKEVKVAK